MKKNFVLVLLAGLFFANSSFAQISYNMESWFSLLGFTFPNGWVASNPLTNNTTVVKDSINKFQGSYSARIETKVLSSNPLSAYFPDTSGFLLSGTLNLITFKVVQGFPYTTRSSSFGLMTKYTPVGTDQAFVYVALMKRNAQGTGTRDTIGSGRATISPSTAFQPSIITIDYASFGYPPSTLPDSAYILISSSKKSGGSAGSTLWVDALQWDPPANLGVADTKAAEVLQFSPQPSSGIFRIQNTQTGNCRLVITDASGKTSEIFNLQSGENVIDSKLPNGLYIGSIYDQEGQLQSRGKLLITR